MLITTKENARKLLETIVRNTETSSYHIRVLYSSRYEVRNNNFGRELSSSMKSKIATNFGRASNNFKGIFLNIFFFFIL
jgi:hypothetical protein